MTTLLRAEQFIVPTGTLVRLIDLANQYNRRYGIVMDWKESFDHGGRSGCTYDSSYYDIRLPEGTFVRAKMANVSL